MNFMRLLPVAKQCFMNVPAGLYLGAAAMGVHVLATCLGSEFVYAIYHTTVFRIVRHGHDFTLGLLPWGSIYWVIGFLAFYLVFLTVVPRQERKAKKISLASKACRGVIHFGGFVLFLFYFLWGFEYYRPSLDKTLAIPPIAPDSVFLKNEFAEITALLCEERERFSAVTKTYPPFLEDSLRSLQESLLASWALPVYGRVRVRLLYPEGLLLRFATAGVYVPFVNEGHIDAGLHPLQWPFTMAHEMAHGYGFTDEGECNFIGLLTCMRSGDPWIRYSGLLAYWRYVYSDVAARHPVFANDIRSQLTEEVRSDMKGIRAQLAKYPNVLPEMREWMYDVYLKSHGVRAGVYSYNQLPLHIFRWKQSKYHFAFRRIERQNR